MSLNVLLFRRRQLLQYLVAVALFSSAACGPVAAATDITPPVDLRAEPRTAAEALVSLERVEWVTAIRVERRDGLEAPFAQVGVTGGDATTHLNTGLTPGATYVWRLRACRDDQCSAYSASVTVTMLGG